MSTLSSCTGQATRSVRIEARGSLPLLAELRAFVGFVDGGPPPKSSAAEGAETVWRAIAALQNAARRDGRDDSHSDASACGALAVRDSQRPRARKGWRSRSSSSATASRTKPVVHSRPFSATRASDFSTVRRRANVTVSVFGTTRSRSRRRRSSATRATTICCFPGTWFRCKRFYKKADFARDMPVNVWPDGSLRYNAFDAGRPEFLELLAAGRGGGGLTGAASTRAAYDRLPFGWRPAPTGGVPTDVHMWQQFLSLPSFRAVTANRLTARVFPSPLRAQMTVDERVAELEQWQERITDAEFPAELERLVAVSTRRAAERLKLTALSLERELDRSGPPAGGACDVPSPNSGRCERSMPDVAKLAERAEVAVTR